MFIALSPTLRLKIVLTRNDCGSSIDIAVDEEFVIQLPENPSTGYRWHLNADSGVIVLSSVFGPASSAAPGAAGVHTWTLCAQNAGRVRVRLKLWRSWMGDESIIDRCEFDLSITS